MIDNDAMWKAFEARDAAVDGSARIRKAISGEDETWGLLSWDLG
jgi:hypothetical protein